MASQSKRRPTPAASPCHWAAAALGLLLSRVLSSATANSRIPFVWLLGKRSKQAHAQTLSIPPPHLWGATARVGSGVIAPCYWPKAQNLGGPGAEPLGVTCCQPAWEAQKGARKAAQSGTNNFKEIPDCDENCLTGSSASVTIGTKDRWVCRSPIIRSIVIITISQHFIPRPAFLGVVGTRTDLREEHARVNRRTLR